MILLLFGQDTYRSKKKLNEFIQLYQKRHQSGLNFIKADLDKDNFSDLKRMIETVSMFAEKKLIVIEEIFKANEVLQADFLDFLKEAKIKSNDDKILIFWATEVKSDNKFGSWLKKNAKSQEFKFLTNTELNVWLKKYLSNHHSRANSLVLNKLIKYIGNDLWRFSHELDKLVAYDGLEIKAESVDLLVRPKIDTNIFETIDALGARNKKRALLLLAGHLKNGESENYLLNRFVYQFRNLLVVKDLLDKGASPKAIERETGLKPFVVYKTHQQARNFNFAELKKIYQRLAEIDLKIKTGQIEAKKALELFITEL